MSREMWEERFENLSDTEWKLITACLEGGACVLGNDTPPEMADPTRTIRAALLKVLITGGLPDHPPTDFGVYLKGAYVTGQLELSFCRAKGPTGLFNCRLEAGIEAMQTEFVALALSGSHLPALNAQGAIVQGGVFLRNGFHATGEVSLSGAEIGGRLSCLDGRFENAGGKALNAEGVKVQGPVFLRDGFHAIGEVRLSGAEIGGQLACDGGRFENAEGDALNAQGARIDAIIFRDVEILSGRVNLNTAHIGSLVDDLASWPGGGRVILDGFTYDRITAGPTDSKTRLDWLSRGDRWKGTFFPQPYTQLAKVLRDMGHERGARDVLVVRDEKIAAEEWRRAHRELDGTWPKAWASLKADFRKFVNWLSHLLIDYGHRPLKALWGLMGLWLFATILAHWVETQGDMVPNSDVILTSENWASVHQANHPAQAWRQTPEGQSWESFNRYAWAADVVIPILDFGQTEAWAPSTNLGTAGKTLWWGKWVLSTAGWIVLAFAAAGVAGVARRE